MRCAFAILFALPALAADPAPAPKVEPGVTAWAECTLPSASGHIRQFAFDKDAASYFASEGNAKKSDHFTLTFEKPVKLASLTVTTGKATGEDKLAAGSLELSEDGAKFESVAKFAAGKAKVDGKDRTVKSVRIQMTDDLKHPLTISDIAIKSDPAVEVFRNPIEFIVDVADAPEMKEWMDKVVRACEKAYPMICEELASEGYKPPTFIKMELKSAYNGVAQAGGGKITGSVKYFKAHQDDIGAFVHETAHCVQNYRGRGLPGWLVEGIADYVRFWKYEPGKAGKVNPDRAKFDGSYRTTAAFLAFVTEKYEPKLVNKLNALLRENKYDADVWKKITGKTVEELNQQWRESLAK